MEFKDLKVGMRVQHTIDRKFIGTVVEVNKRSFKLIWDGCDLFWKDKQTPLWYKTDMHLLDFEYFKFQKDLTELIGDG